jgi:hypothetical protein
MHSLFIILVFQIMGVNREQCMSVLYTDIWFALYKGKLSNFFLSTISLSRLQLGMPGGMTNLKMIFDLYVLLR